MPWLRYLRSIFSEAARAVLPICLLLLIFKAVFLGLTSPSLAQVVRGMSDTLLIAAGALLIVFGLSLFLQGLEHSLLPLGRNVGSALPQTARLWAIILFSLLLGALATVAEPDLKVYVDKTLMILGGRVGRTGLMAGVATGAALGLTLGILRIALRIRFVYVLLPLVFSAGVLTLFCPSPLNLSAWDFAPVVSGSVTVPLFLALGIGLAAVLGGESPGTAGFGLITLASLGPVIAVLILGLTSARGLPLKPAPNSNMANLAPQVEAAPASRPDQASFLEPGKLLRTAGHVLQIIVPVYLFLFLFQRLVLKRSVHNLAAVITGGGMMVFGLVPFFEGLESGFFPLAEGVGRVMPQAVPAAWANIGLCLVLGMAVTFAEPAVLVFAKQVEKATAGAVPRRFLYLVLGVGVAIGFGLGVTVIWFNLPLPAVLLPVLTVELILTFLAPERYALLAWDALGVTSGAITVPFFMAMGLGLSSSVRQGAGLAGLGLIIMASVGPVLSLLVVGVIAGRKKPHWKH